MISSYICLTDSLIWLNVTDMGPYLMSTFTTAGTIRWSVKKSPNVTSVISSHHTDSWTVFWTMNTIVKGVLVPSETMTNRVDKVREIPDLVCVCVFKKKSPYKQSMAVAFQNNTQLLRASLKLPKIRCWSTRAHGGLGKGKPGPGSEWWSMSSIPNNPTARWINGE